MTIAEHIENAFPQSVLPAGDDIEDVIEYFDGDASSLRAVIKLPYSRYKIEFEDPDFIFYARSSLLKFMLGSYLLTLVTDEVQVPETLHPNDFALATLVLVSAPENGTAADVCTEFADLTLYQCRVVADCLRCSRERLDDFYLLMIRQALSVFWDRFPTLLE